LPIAILLDGSKTFFRQTAEKGNRLNRSHLASFRGIPWVTVPCEIRQHFDAEGAAMAKNLPPQVRVLVVDDYEPFRRLVCSTLQKRPELQVIGEASDGLEAVQKAEELKPDLILLDIGLPTLNGIDVSRRISMVVPGAKILVVTQNNDADVARAVLSDGASGYVLKIEANRELLRAVEVVLQGGQFVSTGVKHGGGIPPLR
jgi:CheY-like chemotaxis protein